VQVGHGLITVPALPPTAAAGAFFNAAFVLQVAAGAGAAASETGAAAFKAGAAASNPG
jgi:hypothetical protein